MASTPEGYEVQGVEFALPGISVTVTFPSGMTPDLLEVATAGAAEIWNRVQAKWPNQKGQLTRTLTAQKTDVLATGGK